MSPAASLLSRFLRPLALALAFALLVPVGSVGHAQGSGEREGVGLLRFLFPRGDDRQRQDRVAPPEAKRQPPANVRRAPSAPPEPAVEVVEKAEDAERVLVIGDFLASGLADGLAAAFSENPDVRVVERANGSSGLVRDDYYDWPGNIGAVIEEEKPAVVVVMIGSNDRQQIRVEGTREEPRSEAWTEEYERRVTELAKAVRDRDLPLVWIGNLPFQSSVMSSDMIAFNDIYRRIVTDLGGEFVDVWDGFVDEKGEFVTNGPDMNGQPAQLRASDGINVTRPGRRKIAFYAEKPLNRLLGTGAATPGSVRPDDGGLQGPAPDGQVPAVIDRTLPVAIDDPALDGGAQLLGASIAPRDGEQHTPAERLLREGVAPQAQPGRADDFSAGRTAPVSRETTTAVPR